MATGFFKFHPEKDSVQCTVSIQFLVIWLKHHYSWKNCLKEKETVHETADTPDL